MVLSLISDFALCLTAYSLAQERSDVNAKFYQLQRNVTVHSQYNRTAENPAPADRRQKRLPCLPNPRFVLFGPYTFRFRPFGIIGLSLNSLIGPYPYIILFPGFEL